MKERTACKMDERSCSSEQLEDALLQCGDLLDLVALTQGLQDGRLDIYDMAERLTNLLVRCEPMVTMATSDDEEDYDVGNEEEADGHCESNVEEEEWISVGENSGDRDHCLLLAGYSDCMTEALRYLVEEEQYSPEHPVVEGLRTHLAQQQDRVLLEAARAHHRYNHLRPVVHLDNSRPAVINNNNNNNNHNQAVEVRNRMTLLTETLCNIRPPAV